MIAAGLLVLRLTMAIVFFGHGAHVLFGAFGGDGLGPGGLTASAEYFSGIGLSPGFFFAVLIGTAQTAGSVLLAAGAFARVVSTVLAILVGLQAWRDAARWGFFLNWTMDQTRGHGLEYFVLLLGMLACLALAGAGDWSIDGIRGRRAAAVAAGRARLRDRA